MRIRCCAWLNEQKYVFLGRNEGIQIIRFAECTFLTRQVIVNCCGPYLNHGEPVVKACIAAGAHQVDVSGEPHFIGRMQLDYDEAARARGVCIISACGFDSIPAEMGCVYAGREFVAAGGSELNSIETYLRTWLRKDGNDGGDPARHRGGALVNFGTWESAVHGIGRWGELRTLRRQLNAQRPEPLPPVLRPALKARPVLHRSATMQGRWTLPFMGADRSVVLQTQQVLWQTQRRRPVQVRTYLSLDAWWHAVPLLVLGLVFGVLARFEWGRWLLLGYPRVFSAGVFSKEGPTVETQRATMFSETMHAVGWTKKAELRGESDQPDKAVTTRVTASNPGYGATTVALLLSARMLLEEMDRLPVK